MKYPNEKYNNLKYFENIITRLMIYFKTDKIIVLAESLNVSQPTISNWKRRGTIDMKLLLEKCENINLNWLFFGEGAMLRQRHEVQEENSEYVLSELARLRLLAKKVKELQDLL
jgi:hypothetical protein